MKKTMNIAGGLLIMFALMMSCNSQAQLTTVNVMKLERAHITAKHIEKKQYDWPMDSYKMQFKFSSEINEPIIIFRQYMKYDSTLTIKIGDYNFSDKLINAQCYCNDPYRGIGYIIYQLPDASFLTIKWHANYMFINMKTFPGMRKNILDLTGAPSGRIYGVFNACEIKITDIKQNSLIWFSPLLWKGNKKYNDWNQSWSIRSY